MRTVVVVPYDDKWPEEFETESLLISRILNGVVMAVHHIGSTAVPGLSAKPVIDIMLEVSDIHELDTCNEAMSRAGYVARSENGIKERRYFTKGGDKRSYQLHAFATGNIQLLRHLAFRDYLLNNREIAAKYAEIKYTAALLSGNEPHRYSALKASFIEDHLRIALTDD